MIAKHMTFFDNIQTISSYFLLISLAFHVLTYRNINDTNKCKF